MAHRPYSWSYPCAVFPPAGLMFRWFTVQPPASCVKRAPAVLSKPSSRGIAQRNTAVQSCVFRFVHQTEAATAQHMDDAIAQGGLVAHGRRFGLRLAGCYGWGIHWSRRIDARCSGGNEHLAETECKFVTQRVVPPTRSYISRRPSMAFNIVTSSVYSMSLPTGIPMAMRVTRRPWRFSCWAR